jgi:hypothetical protein
MDDGRRHQMEHIREQVSADAYRIDASAVAAALLRMLLAIRQT